MKKRISLKTIPFLAVVVLPLILLGRVIFSGRALYWGLPSLQFIPWQAFAWEQIQQGGLPLWNPLNGMGAPFLANYQLAFFYPPTWLLYAVHSVGGVSWLAWANTVLVYLHLVWAGIGMGKLVKEFGGKELAQTIAALSFSLSGFLIARVGFFSVVWAATWMPWVVRFSGRIASPLGNEESQWFERFISIPLVLSVSALLLAGHAQIGYYILLYGLIWVVAGAFIQYGWREAVVSTIRLGIHYLLSIMVSAIQLIPTMEYLLLSQRTAAVEYETAMAYSFWPWRFITFLAPDFFGNPGRGDYWGYASFHEDAVYIGLLPFLLALSTVLLFASRKMRQKFQPIFPGIKLLWGVIAIGVLLALGRFTPIFPFLFDNVPTFDMFHGPVRIMIWVVFSMSLLASLAAEKIWKRPTGRGLYWTRLGTAGAAAITIGAFAGWYFLRDVNVTFIRATALTGLWGLGIGILTLIKPLGDYEKSPTWLVAVVVWLCIDLLVAGWWLNPGIDRDFYLPQSRQTYLSEIAGDGRVYHSLSDNYNLKFKRFVRFNDYRPIEPLSNMRLIELPNLNLLDGVASVNNFDPFVPERYAVWMEYLDGLTDEELTEWLSLMNVSILEKIVPGESLGVEMVKVSSQGRFEFIECGVPADDDEKAWALVVQRVENGNVNPSDYVVIETDEVQWDCDEEGASVTDSVITVINDRATFVELQVENEENSWLVVRDVWHPGWKTYVDGDSSELFIADFLFRAVPVPSGKHLVQFIYRPFSIVLGSVISIIGVIVLIVIRLRRRILPS